MQPETPINRARPTLVTTPRAKSTTARADPPGPSVSALLRELRDGTCVIDPAGCVRAANRRFHQMLGLTASAVRPGTEFSEIIVRQAARGDFGPCSEAEARALLADALAAEQGGCWTGQLPDGCAFRITCRPLDHQFRLLLCESHSDQVGARDEVLRLRELLEAEIASREQLEQQYLTNAEYLQLFVGNTPAAVAMLNRDLRYLFASQRWLKNNGLRDRDVVGRSHYELFPEIPERWKGVHRRVLATGIGEQSEEDCIMRADGTLEWSRWKVHPWLTASGEVGGLILFSEVISERKNLENRLLQAQRMEAVGQMTGGLAHDFNNLLTVVGGNLGFLREQLALDCDNRTLVDEALAAVRHGAELTHRLLAFSRGRETTPQVFNVGVAVTDLARLMQRTLPRNIQLEVVVQGGPWFCRVHRAQLESALLNLAINSRDAMPEGGSLKIEVTPDFEARGDDQFVMIRVQDSGTGMAPEVIESATEAFFSTKEVGKGTGLGLNMVKRFVALYRGRLEIASQVGEGTTMSLALPQWQGDVADVVEAAPPSPPTSRSPEIDLLIEEGQSIRRSTAAMLEALGTAVQGTDSRGRAQRERS